MGLISYTLWFALKLIVNENERQKNYSLRNFTWTIIIVIAVQLIYGALMAGHKAATAAPTWPDINGMAVPENLFAEKPAMINFIDNKLLIHFIHRTLAYALLVLVIAWFIKAKKTFGLLKKNAALPLVIVALQILLGILTVVNSTSIIPNQWGIFEWLAQFHQLVGMLLLLSFVYMLFLATGKRIQRG
jgi:cytochrome c oxidase assembly protein subunit 15